jgi:chitosanase
MLTEKQKKAAQAIVNIFETGKVEGDYGKVTLLSGDPGHLTYGRSQTTLASGNLFLLIKAYTENDGAEFGSEFSEYLHRLFNRDVSLDHDTQLRNLLREAGFDPVMQDVQDQFFDRVYWNPSQKAAQMVGIATGLGYTVVYDSKIHGSWIRMRDRTTEQHGSAENIGEEAWVEKYVSVRKDWLANHSIKILRKTIYRMEAFEKLMSQGNWTLEVPFTVRGIRIDEETLGEGPIRVSAQDVEERLLRLQSPFMQGNDVQFVQQALSDAGIPVDVDGIFGPQTENAIKEFQQQQGLTVDGIVGPATLAALEL